ncbi:MAG: hypothetical protein ACC608_02050 [Anaerofustis sp.]
MIFNNKFNLPQYLLGNLAGGRPQGGDGGGRVKIEYGQKILVLQILIGVDAAAFHQHVGNAYHDSFPKCHACVKFIIVL